MDLETTPLPTNSLERIRRKARLALEDLRAKIDERAAIDDNNDNNDDNTTTPTKYSSWVRRRRRTASSTGDDNDDDDDDDDDGDAYFLANRSLQCRYLDTYGFLVIKNFCNATQVQSLKRAMVDRVNQDWHPGRRKRQQDHDGDDGDDNENDKDAVVSSFGTDAQSNTKRGDYFLDSADRVHFFAEPGALVEKDGTLKEEYYGQKSTALNKAGHGLHLPSPSSMLVPSNNTNNNEQQKETNKDVSDNPFYHYTTSSKLRQLVQDLGWRDPIVPQSMYIFKQAHVGGTVHSHQDSTFLFTTPSQSCLGLWLALDPATLSNGCLWVRPGSHHEPVRRQFIRNPEYYGGSDQDPATNNGGGKGKDDNEPPPKLVFRTLHEDPDVTWEGSLPSNELLLGVQEDDEAEKDEDGKIGSGVEPFIPVECEAGDLVVFVGTLDHFSLPNFSAEARHTFQLHLVEGPRVGITWSPENWLQYSPEKHTCVFDGERHPAFLQLVP